MTRKDYKLIAAAIAAAKNDTATAVNLLADALAIDNPRFDRVRFLEACRS